MKKSGKIGKTPGGGAEEVKGKTRCDWNEDMGKKGVETGRNEPGVIEGNGRKGLNATKKGKMGRKTRRMVSEGCNGQGVNRMKREKKRIRQERTRIV